MKKHVSTIILILILLIGLSLLLYPTISNYWNTHLASRVISEYDSAIGKMDKEEQERIWKEAVAFNKDLREKGYQGRSEAYMERYNKCLAITENGCMGYIDIPKLNLSLPIYHGTDVTVLEAGVGHLEWTSLPTGGVGTHCVLSGHRGLPSAKLFTDLDRIREGDLFMLTVLDQVMAYQVDQIRVVEPEDTSDLQIDPEKDYCTLVTCTPYGINTHRMLVRGHRVATLDYGRIMADATILDTLLVALFLAIPILLTLLVLVLLRRSEKKRKKLQEELMENLNLKYGGKIT